jgi:3-dehydroquinate synthase
MLMAADLSCRMGQFDQQYVDRLRKLLARAGLPVFAPKALDAQRFVELMGMDKKVKAGRLRLIVMRGLGAAEVRGDVPESLLHATLAEFPRGEHNHG